MNDLPPELIAIIIRDFGLSYQDKRNCRLVCKKWNAIVNQLKEDCLLLSSRVCLNETWFYTNKWVNPKDQVLTDLSYQLIPQPLLQTTFSNLKKLYILISTFDVELDPGQTINHLKQLEQLQLNRVNLKQKSELRLPQLKIFSLSTIADVRKIKLETPKLKALRTVLKDMAHEFVYPQTITYLVVDDCEPIIDSLTNLEYLCAKKFAKISPATLIGLKHLKEIHNMGYSPFGFNRENLNLFQLLYQQKQLDPKLTFKLFVCGLDYASFLGVDQNHYQGSVIMPFYSANYDRLVPLIYEERFVFNKFDFRTGAIPRDFFYKFPNIKQVLCENTREERLFLEFLSKVQYLDNLHLDLLVISPQNCDKLADCCPRLTCLEIFNVVPISLEFIFRFRYLTRFSIDRMVEFNFVRIAFEKLKHLQFFRFDFNLKPSSDLCLVSIQKAGQDRFQLLYKDHNPNKEYDLETIFDILNEEVYVL